MKYEIEYEICLDEDFPNRIGYADVEAENEKEAVEKFKKLGIFKAVITEIVEIPNEWVECKGVFSNGTEFELFLSKCFECSYYRNDNCKILNKCYEAMFDKSMFPFEYLLDHYKYGGKKCKRFSKKPLQKHKRNRNKKSQIELEV